MRKIQNRIFLFAFIFIIMLGSYSIVRTPKTESKTENRTLTQFPHFTIRGFYREGFQKYFSEALSDQFIMGETIKKTMNKYTNFVNYRKLNKSICSNRYLKINEDYAIFDCAEGLLYNHKIYDESVEKRFYETMNTIKNLSNVDLYLYFVNDSYNLDFENNKMVYDIPKIFKDYKYDMLKINNFQEFDNYFYDTDHHWNYQGSYQGYKDIAKLIGIEDVIEPTGTKEFDIKFYGSMARISKVEDFYDKFTVYEFDIPEHKEFLNNKKGLYGTPNKYYDGTYSKEKLANHYAYYYGSDYREVSYSFDNPGKGNLLIISNSFSNAVNELLAASFNKTYIVDIRHYKDFNYKKYIKDNKIDKVLILGNYNLFLNDVFLNYNWEV